MTAPTFRRTSVEIDGARMSWMEAGEGAPIVHFPAASAPTPTRAHELLAGDFRVLVFEPRDGLTPALVKAVAALGRVNVMGSAAGSATALALARALPAEVRALVLEAPPAPGADAGLAAVETPTLVLFGTDDDVASPAIGRVYKERLPNAHLVFVYGGGHAIGAHRPEAFAEVVVDFLERHEAFVISRANTVIHP